MNSFYLPGHNSFTVPNLFDLPFSAVILLTMFTMAIFLFRLKLRHALFMLTWSLVIISIALQAFAQGIYWTNMRQLSYKSFENRKEDFFGSAYVLAHCAQTKLKGQHYQGKLVSSLDPSFSLIPSFFYYELYPVVNLKPNSPDPKVRICFRSPECVEDIPKNFHVLCTVNEGYVALRGELNVQDRASR